MGDYHEGLNEGKNIAKQDIEYLNNCFRKYVLEASTIDNFDVDRIAKIMKKYSISINENLDLVGVERL